MSKDNKVFTGRACFISGVKQLTVENRDVIASDDRVVVKITRGGICGSDIHYYYHGGVGDLKLQHPMLLGHEVIGRIVSVPPASALQIGQKVAINPSLPCGQCRYCLEGKSNHCRDMRFFGSAMRNPHIHGGFADYLAVEPQRCVPYDATVSDKVMCFAEPLSVAIHAVNLAGSLIGRHILVSGAGPIGCLIVAAAKACGAESITVFDISEKSRNMALAMGANRVIDPIDEQAVAPFKADKGYFDITFDASGAQPAIELAVAVTRPLGNLIQVGNSRGLMGFPIMDLVAKEISWRGSFRFNQEFYSAVNWLENGRIDPLPLLSFEFDGNEIEKAICLAADKTQSAKIQLTFE